MRAPAEILLVSCYELGHQPLSLASPLAFLTRAGYQPAAVDASIEPLSDAAIARARFVGIAVPMHTALRLGVRIAERVRAVNPAAHICFYGLYATLNADYLLRAHADSVIGGEYEQALLDLVSALARHTGVVNGGVTTRASAAPLVLKRLAFAVPERGRLAGLDRYARFVRDGEHRLAGYVEASRGCLHHCRHCPIPPVYGGRFFVIPAEVVLEDIRRQVALGAEHVTFGDPDFLNGPGHVMRIVRTMHAELPNLTFDATIKIEHVVEHAKLFPELRDLGCAFVVSAVESLSDVVLERLAKGHTRHDIVEALAILDNAGIPLRPTFVPFAPWATLDDYLELLEFVAVQGLVYHVDPVQYTIRLLVPPGSALLEQPETRDWLGTLDAGSFTYRWSHPDARMDRLQHEVSAIVEAAARRNEDAALTFAMVRDCARAAGGLTPSRPALEEPPAQRARPPRLSESWFC